MMTASPHVFEIGMVVTYQGCPHRVVGITPMSVNPRLVDLEDPARGELRRVASSDAGLELANDSLRTATSPALEVR
jgi:hypothetical protein